MEAIEQRVQAAWRRLVMRQWAGRLARSWTVAFAVALVAVLAPKLFVMPGLPAWWSAAWLGGAAGAGLIAATAWTWARPKSRLEAAVEIDTRYGLRERVASALSLGEGLHDTEAGAALLRDAERAIAQVEVNERFTLGIDAAVLRPLGSAALAVMAAALLGNAEADASPEASPTDQAVVAEQAKEAAEQTRKRLEKKREQAEKQGLKDASALLKKVEEGTADLAKREAQHVAKTAAKLNDLAKQLEDRKRKLGGSKELRDQFNRMKDLSRGPAEKAADAMKQGDWQRAMKEFQKLQQQVASGKATKEQQAQLANQLEQMQQKLKEAAAKHEAQKKELERQLAEAQRKGDLNQAGKLQQKLDQMAMKTPAMQQLEQMAQQMKQAQQAMQQGKPQDAAQAMQQLAQQMQKMQQADAEMKMLDAAMTDIQACKNGMCNNPGQGLGQMPGGKGKGKPGRGMGEGRGEGERPDEEHDVAFRDSQVKQDVGRGASTFGGLVEGPSVKGQVVESIKAPLSSDAAEPADPLTSERLPRSRREHAEEYFRGLRERL